MRQQAFVALFHSLEIRPPKSHRCTPCCVLAPVCDSVSAHAACSAESLCFSGLKLAPTTTGFLPSPGWAPAVSSQLQGWVAHFPSAFQPIQFVPACPPLMLQCADLRLYVEQWILYWIIAVQIAGTLRGETKGSLLLLSLWPESSEVNFWKKYYKVYQCQTVKHFLEFQIYLNMAF